MSTCNQLDLQTLGSRPIMPKHLPDHWEGGRCSKYLDGGRRFGAVESHHCASGGPWCIVGVQVRSARSQSSGWRFKLVAMSLKRHVFWLRTCLRGR
jgi:hypothetical protein